MCMSIPASTEIRICVYFVSQKNYRIPLLLATGHMSPMRPVPDAMHCGWYLPTAELADRLSQQRRQVVPDIAVRCRAVLWTSAPRSCTARFLGRVASAVSPTHRWCGHAVADGSWVVLLRWAPTAVGTPGMLGCRPQYKQFHTQTAAIGKARSPTLDSFDTLQCKQRIIMMITTPNVIARSTVTDNIQLYSPYRYTQWKYNETKRKKKILN